jgi:hypothetical protein
MSMNKPHLEFSRVDLSAGWATPPGYPAGIQQKILASDFDESGKTGSRTRLLRFEPGTYTGAPFVHDHWEEVYLISGDLIVGNDACGEGGEAFTAPTYACRPPDVRHGPFKSKDGCILFEIHYYGGANRRLLLPRLAGSLVFESAESLHPRGLRSSPVCKKNQQVNEENLAPGECPTTREKNHPRNFCYQCKKPLPPDYRDKPWNIDSSEHHPMFDSKRCKDIAIRRHLHSAFDFTNLTNYLDDAADRRSLKPRDHEFEPEAGAQHDRCAEAEAFRDLVDEYRRFEKRYEQSPPALSVGSKT